jgi:flagellar protein FliO/FliZ
VNTAADAALLARVTLSLLVVVLLAVIGARLARRTVLRGRGRNLQVLERLPLSREASLAVVSVAGRGLVLGVTSQGVRVLSELDGETLARAYPEPEPSAEPPSDRRPARAVRVGPDGVTVTRLTDDGTPAPPRTGTRTGTPAPPRTGTRTRTGTGSVLDPRTWRQAVQAVRDLTVRRG